MNEPAHLAATRASYDHVSAVYAERYPTWNAESPLDRGLLTAFAELVTGPEGAGRPVADLGCGTGRMTAKLAELGVPAFGVDLSPGMLGEARRLHPGLRFEEGTITDLAIEDASLSGILAWYSTFHTPPDELPAVFAEFHRILAPGGHLLLGTHLGEDDHLRPEEHYGLPVSYEVWLLPQHRLAGLLTEAGLEITAHLRQEPGRTAYPQLALLAHRPTSVSRT
jgi:SAM-dependent methyltransferase